MVAAHVHLPFPTHDVDFWFPVPHDRRAPGTARRLLANSCGFLPDSIRAELALLVSELVTNAVVHGRPDVTVHCVVTDRSVRVDVFDHGVAMAGSTLVVASATQSGGRGLAIVDSLATRWGTTEESTVRGKSVWFELRLKNAS